MPNYTSNAQSQLLRTNQQAFFWNNEFVTAPQLSVGFQLERVSHSFYPWGLSVEVVFSGDPGAFEIDIMAANNDNKANYIQVGSITSASGSTVAGNYVGRWDMPSYIWPKFVAAYVKTLTNPVTVTCQVTR